MTTFSKPGRGRKQCPDCKVYVGARVVSCDCGHEFKFNESSSSINPVNELTRVEIEAETFVTSRGGKRGRVILTPAGDCPIKLKSPEKDVVEEWCDNMMLNGYSQSIMYTPHALAYFASHFFDTFSEEYKFIRSVIWAWGGLNETFETPNKVVFGLPPKPQTQTTQSEPEPIINSKGGLGENAGERTIAFEGE